MSQRRQGTPTERYFQAHSSSFDRAYEHGWRSRVSTGLRRGLTLSESIISSQPGASVLDVGCGPGRVGEAVLRAGASSYTGIDLSPAMIEIASNRLAPFGQAVRLAVGDIVDACPQESFDVVLALGIWEYVDDPRAVARCVAAVCRDALLCSFPYWTWVKGPLRSIHYGRSGCRLRYYSDDKVVVLLQGHGFTERPAY